MKKGSYLFGLFFILLFIPGCKKDHSNTPVNPGVLNDNSITLSDSVIDAEYNRKKDLMVVVSVYPNNLMIVDPISKTATTIVLNLEPTCVSISPNGNYVAVGHNGWVSYFNMNSKTLISMQAITCDANDIIITNDAWAYVFPKNTQWDRIRCLNLSLGTTCFNTGGTIYGNNKAKLHPSGNFIYGADNGSTPDDLERYNLLNDTAKYVYNNLYYQYSQSYSHGGNLWIAEDSTRIFTRSKNVFYSTNVDTTDLSYASTLSGAGNIMSLDYSKIADRVYASFDNNIWANPGPDTIIRKYKATDLSFLGTVTLPKLYIPNTKPVSKKNYSYGYFGFFNAAGTMYYAVVKAIDNTTNLNKWAVVSITVQ
jgi:hypothetical protein